MGMHVFQTYQIVLFKYVQFIESQLHSIKLFKREYTPKDTKDCCVAGHNSRLTLSLLHSNPTHMQVRGEKGKNLKSWEFY